MAATSKAEMMTRPRSISHPPPDAKPEPRDEAATGSQVQSGHNGCLPLAPRCCSAKSWFNPSSDQKADQNPKAHSNADTQGTGDKPGHRPPAFFSSPNACRIAGSGSHEPHQSRRRLRHTLLMARARTSVRQLLCRRKTPATRGRMPTKALSELSSRVTYEPQC